MWSLDDLVVAPATPPGGGCRGIVRIGGAGLDEVLAALFSPAPPGFAVAGGGCRVVTAVPAADGPLASFGGLPVTILHWPGPDGPTGQPLAEVQLPGSGPIIAAVVRAACDHSARLARGGEFSLRSFLAGRLGLIEAEAILAVVDAATPAELSAALDRMAGGVGRDVAAIRESLLDLAADVEAAIDFADERTPDAVPAAEQALLAAVGARLAAAAAAVDRVAARLEARDAGPAAAVPRVVVVGPPNIGKSSLVNALLGRDAALVADEPGTTRDAVAGRLTAAEGGPTCLLVDVAGLEDESGATPRSAIDAAAQARAREEFTRADVLVSCRDAASATPAGDGRLSQDSLWDRREAIPAAPVPRKPEVFLHGKTSGELPPRTDGGGFGRPVIPVITRCDRGPPPAAAAGELCTSGRTGLGIARLRERILRAAAAVPSPSSPATVRLATGLAAARDALAAACAAASAVATGGADEAVVAGLVREAVAILGEVTGAEIGDDLVDRIFSRHCIGK